METKLAGLTATEFDQVRVHQSLRPGDTAHLTSECTGGRRSKTKPDRGIAESHTKLFNQRDELVFSVRCTMMVAARPEDA